MTHNITIQDIYTAEEISQTTDRTKLWNLSRRDSSLVRLAVALNPHTDWEVLEKLENDSDSMVSEIAKKQIAELQHVESIFLNMIRTGERISRPDAKMDARGISVVRHYTNKDVEDLSTIECISEMVTSYHKDG